MQSKDDILKTFIESCRRVCNIIQSKKDKGVQNKIVDEKERYLPSNKLLWQFTSGNLALSHENATTPYSPADFLQYFSSSAQSTAGPCIYENALLIDCIDEICSTDSGVSVYYYTIISRLSAWFDSFLNTAGQNDWLMHPLLKEAIASSDFIFQDPILGDLFLQKLSKIDLTEDILIALLQLIADLQIQHQKLSKKIHDIMVDR